MKLRAFSLRWATNIGWLRQELPTLEDASERIVRLLADPDVSYYSIQIRPLFDEESE